MRWLKLSLKILGGIVALILLLWLGLAAFINFNKKTVLAAVTKQLNENINGVVSIENMEPTLIRGFPGISISLKNVVLRDSMYSVHKHNLLEAKNIYVSVNALSVIQGGARIRDISIADAKIYLFTDSNGYSNTSIFRKAQNPDTVKKKNQPRINHLFFDNVNLVFENKTKAKLFELAIDDLETILDYTTDGWKASIDVDTKIKQFNFNTVKGSFLKNKRLVTKLTISYDKKNETLNIPEQLLNLDDDDILLGGKFVFAIKPASFVLTIKANKIAYKNAISLLSPSIAKKISILDFKKPIDLQASLQGSMKFRDTPLVKVNWQVKDNTFITPGGAIEKCSFNGMFINQLNPNGGMNDGNSAVLLQGFKGEWSTIPFQADTVSITNLKSPILEGRFTSKFPLTKLNPIIGGNSFILDKGNVNVDLLYKAGIRNNDTTQPYIYGTVKVTDIAMTYIPRSLSFTNSSATLRFMGSDLFLNNVRLQKGTNVLNMEGSMRNFVNLYYTDPEKILLDWHIRSAQLNLNEFRSFLVSRKKEKTNITKTANGAKVNRMSNQLDKVLDASSVRMEVNINKVIYRQFTATNINAIVSLTQQDVALQNISLNHAGGTLRVNAHLKPAGNINAVAVKADIQHVNIKEFLRAFENFGQTSLTDENIQGKLSAQVDVTGNIKDDGTIMPRSFNGNAAFELVDGALVNFEPLKKISKFVFRKRNLDNITFGTIKNKFDIRGDKLTIYPMYIESSVLNMNVEGVYALGKGTDIKVHIPLRNPKKDELILDKEDRHERNMKGLVLHLNAVDGDDGKIKIKWLKKSKEERGKDVETSEQKKSDTTR